MNILAGGIELTGLSNINVLLGKNGCGKSRLLTAMEAALPSGDGDWGHTKYITPERGGALSWEAGIEQNMITIPTWMRDTRRVNQFAQFRQQSVAQYRKLETLVLREVEANQSGSFDPYVEKMNSLLDNVEIRREDVTFKIYSKHNGAPIEPTKISSGESELISLAIECLVFAKELVTGKRNVLFLDEPDVHLHPDLQTRLVQFLKGLIAENEFLIVVATHSTALLGELADYGDAAVSFMKPGETVLQFRPIGHVYRKVLPVFGAHPLSNVFNQAPVLLVEGEDDERIWQQAVRSSDGRLRLYPVPCDGVEAIADYEAEVKRIVEAVYEDPKAYSLRDRDDGNEHIENVPPIIRMKLACRTAENLLLTNEVLSSVGLSWDAVQASIGDWLDRNEGHARAAAMRGFKDNGFDRKGSDLKDLRVLLTGSILVSSKPWEVLVGQAIGQLAVTEPIDCSTEGSLLNFLGKKVSEHLVPRAGS